VARLAGKDTELLGIDRHAEHAAAEAAHTVGIGPEVVAFIPELACLVTRFIEAQPIPPEAMREPAMLERVVPAIRAFHGGPSLPSSFSPFRMVEAYAREAQGRGVPVPEEYDDLRVMAGEIEGGFDSNPIPSRPCHNDLLNANFLLAGDRVYIVDYEYAGMGDLFFDLGNLSINNGISEDAQMLLLELYFGRVTPADVARLKLMRVMSDFREAMWGVVQQGLSTLDFDYVDYAGRHLARCLESARDAGFRGWLDDAATWI